MSKGKVFAIGGAQVILPFRAGGAVLYPADSPESVAGALEKINAQPAGSLVLITEDAAAAGRESLEKFEQKGRHAFMVVPTRAQRESKGLEKMRQLIIRSVGVDLISKAPAAKVGEEIVVETGQDF